MKDIHDFKIVGIVKYFKYKKQGWNLNCIEYLLISNLIHRWRLLNTTNKISIIAIAVAVLIFFIDKCFL
jgi:hypothetical protein